MPRIAIFAALQWECRTVLSALRAPRRERVGAFGYWLGTAPRGEIWLLKTGVGTIRAAAAARAVAERGDFALFVSTGCAGGLDSTLRPGDLVVAGAVRDGISAAATATDPAEAAGAAAAAAAAGLRVLEGTVLCSPTALLGTDAKHAAARAGSVAVEMEATPIAAQAAAAGIPFLSVRAILDGVDAELPSDPALVDPASGAMRPLTLAAWAATHPGAIIALRRMQRAAQNSLERFFRAWLG